MILDTHVHVSGTGRPDTKALLESMRQAGVDGGVILGLSPRTGMTAKERLDNLFQWTGGETTLYPFFWIDPTAPDAPEQVDKAVERGVAGFKVICSTHFPGDERALPVYQRIADYKRPMLFHSGILWDGQPSAQYNRPGNFEALMVIDGLRFAMAHISWPWYDECIAVYGKIADAKRRNPALSCEMFIDFTPGTPKIYRDDAVTKVFTVGYDVKDNVLYGTDNHTDYDAENARAIMGWDDAIFHKLGLSYADMSKYYYKNLLRFLGERV